MSKLACIPVVMFGFVGLASAQSATYAFDQAADFATYKTYTWVEIPGSVKLNNLASRHLIVALEFELARKGLAKTKNDSASLLIGYQASTVYAQIVAAFSAISGYPRLWREVNAPASAPTLTPGSIALDMYDSSRQELVWRGTATKAFDPSAKPDQQLAGIQKSAEKLLSNFPPKNK